MRLYIFAYKDLLDPQADLLELMLGRLYAKWSISDQTDFSALAPEDYPILSQTFMPFWRRSTPPAGSGAPGPLSPELLRDLLLGLHSLCRGADSRFFNGPTNVPSSQAALHSFPAEAEKLVHSAAPPLPASLSDLRGPQSRFLVFGVKDALHADRRLRNLLPLNILGYFRHRLLTAGHTVAVLDERYHNAIRSSFR